jgi:soluble lytic murein transglycosylase
MLLISFIPSIFSITPQSISEDAVPLAAASRQWQKTETQAPPETLKALKQAVDLYEKDLYAAALEVLPDEWDAKSFLIGDYLLLFRARSRFMLKQYQEALDDFRLLEKQYPESSLNRDALMGQCQALLELNNPQSVLALLDRDKQYVNSETLYYRARALHQKGEKEEAAALYLRIYSGYIASEYSSQAENSLLSLAPGALKGAHNYSARVERAQNLLKANESQRARNLLLALGKVSAPDSKASQKRRLLQAEADYRLNRTTSALTSLQKITAADPVLHARALYLEASCRRRQDQEQAFLDLREKALKLYSKSSETEELCYSVATYFDVNYEAAKARKAYTVLHDAFPKGRYAERALWKLALFSYQDAHYDEAVQEFYRYLLAYPDPPSAASAMYWMGRCFQKLGDSSKAQYLFERVQALSNESYYGERAREANASMQKAGNSMENALPGLDFKQVTATCEKIRFSPILHSDPDGNGVRIIDRASQLLAGDMQKLALSELRWGMRQYPKNYKILNSIMARIFAAMEDFNGAISCLRNVYPDYNGRPFAALPDEARRLLFPVLHLNFISTQAAATNLEPSLILGVIRQESAFKEDARSKANARGLMQIMPSTGFKLARRANILRYNSNKLYQAETNITLGTRHLAYLFQKYGRSDLALAAYNAGESRVDRWLKEYGNVDVAEFVEQIPFGETRNYVKQILSNQSHYRILTSDILSEDR